MMDFESAEECHEYNKKQLLDRDDSDHFLLLERLLRQIPDEFRDNKIFDPLKERHLKEENNIKKLVLIEKGILASRLENYRLIINCLEQGEEVKIECPWGFEGKQTISSSIFPDHQLPSNHIVYDFPFTVWFEATVNLFYAIRKHFEIHLGESLEPEHLIGIEIDNLNTFFETGVYVSVSFYSPIADKEVHEYYNGLLWGESPRIGCRGDILMGKLDKLEKHLAEGEMTKMDMLADVMQENLKRDWFTSINLQALLWLKGYLEELEKYKKPLPLDIGLENVGFQVAKADETIPVLYEALIEQGYIKEDGVDNFKKAFRRGEGYIKWIDTGTCLAYLLDELQNDKIILTVNFWKVTENVFDYDGKYQSLKASATKAAGSKKLIINNIVKTLTPFLQ